LEASIGIDIGGTKMLVGLIRADGRVLDRERAETRPTFLVEDMTRAVAAMLERASAAGLRVRGIGVAVKGFVDPEAGILVRSMSLDLEDLPVASLLATSFGLPVRVENDVHACTLGELRFGLGRTHRSFIVLNAGTGISAGFVVGGRLHVGAGGSAGEIGHMVVAADEARRCVCGRTGCLEDLILRCRAGETITMAPDERYGALTTEYRLLAIGLTNLVNAFNPSAVALAGGMLLQNPKAAEDLAAAVRRLCLRSAASVLGPIAPAFGGYEAGLVGAGSLPFLDASERATLTATREREADVQA
jgi:glucokinase